MMFTLLLDLSTKTAWYFTRSSATVAYMLLVGSTIWGLLLSSKLIKESVPPVLSLAMHNLLAWLAIIFSGLHGFTLLFDTYYRYMPADLLIPFTGPYRPGWVGIGVISFYLMILISASFYWRKHIGQTWWRRLHLLTLPLYVLITIHGLMAGTDSDTPGMKSLYAGSTLLVLFLTNYRIVSARTGTVAVKSRRSLATEPTE
jgi:DMSO/TMAO reductase YedYZ heme-binding membrane subunit